jgi:hypothetical protein
MSTRLLRNCKLSGVILYGLTCLNIFLINMEKWLLKTDDKNGKINKNNPIYEISFLTI